MFCKQRARHTFLLGTSRPNGCKVVENARASCECGGGLIRHVQHPMHGQKGGHLIWANRKHFSALTGAKSNPYFWSRVPLFSSRARARVWSHAFRNLTVKTFSCHKSRSLLFTVATCLHSARCQHLSMLHAREDGRAGTCQQAWGRIYVCLHVSSALTFGQSSVLPSPLNIHPPSLIAF